MNPVTRRLVDQLGERRIARFVARWDALEALVIRVYREKAASPHDETAYARLRRWLHRRYAGRQDALRPYWQAATINDRPLTEDPFLCLLAVERAAGFVDNWPAMQTLPAARQALNEWLVDRLNR